MTSRISEVRCIDSVERHRLAVAFQVAPQHLHVVCGRIAAHEPSRSSLVASSTMWIKIQMITDMIIAGHCGLGIRYDILLPT